MNHRRARLRWFAFCLTAAMVCVLAGLPVLAQLANGTILGVVKDTTGGSVAGASVTVTNTDTGLNRTASTEADGSYRFAALPVGNYQIQVVKEGFQTFQRKGITLEVTQEASVDVTLQVGSTGQTVVVTEEAPLVNTTSSSLGGLVNEDKISDLPLNGRNYADLTLMQTGVSQNKNSGSGEGMAGTWFSSNGAPVRSNNYTMDGAVMQNQFGGSSSSEAGTTLGVDGVREYRVVTNGFSAEYGNSMGGQVVMVSKGGSNKWSGDIFEYLRNSAMDARNFFDYGYLNGGPRLPAFQRNNFGGAGGGPIKKDKTFFFAVYEGLRQNLGFTAVETVFPSNCYVLVNNPCATNKPSATDPGYVTGTVAAVMRPLLALYPQPSPSLGSLNEFTQPTQNKASDDFGQIRVDQNISQADTMFGRYTVDQGYVNNANGSTATTGSTGVAWPQIRVQATNRNQYLTLGETHIFSPVLLNTARLSFSRTNFAVGNLYSGNVSGPGISFVQLPTGQYLPYGGITVPGTTGFGPNTTYGPPSVYGIQNVYTGSDDIYYTRGRHALKIGLLFNRFNEGIQGYVGAEGSIAFGSQADFFEGIPTTYSAQTPGSNGNRFYTYNTIGLYMQDDWRAASRLTLNLGIRYEFRTTPHELNHLDNIFRNITTDKTTTAGGPVMLNPTLKDFSPRIGFAWDVRGNGKTSIRSAFGIYYDVANIGTVLEQTVFGTPPLSSSSSVNNQTNRTPLASLPLSFAGAQGISLFTIDYNAKSPYSLQDNLTVEQQLPFGMGLSVSYVGSRGIHIYTIIDGNPTPPTSITNGVDFWGASVNNCANTLPTCRVNPNWGKATFVTNGADSWYNSMQVVLNKRVMKGLEFQSAFTWAKSLDTTEGQQAGVECTSAGGNSRTDQFNNRTDKGPTCSDVKFNEHLNLLYHFPNVKSDFFAAKLLQGWWMGNIISVQTGYPFNPTLSTNRSRSQETDRPDLGTTATSATFTVQGKPVTYNFVPYNASTVITGDPQHWFNPLMFQLPTVGYLGNSSRDFLRGPGLGEWDFSLVKDTPLPLWGEKANVEFRAEIFNILNRANFGTPNASVFSGTVSDTGANSEAPAGATVANPLGTVGQITTTQTSSRQVQLALKIIF